MQHRIVQKEATTVVGMVVKTTTKESKIPQLWDQFIPRIQEIGSPSTPGEFLGVCFYMDMQDFDEETEFEYMASVEVDEVESIPEDMMARHIGPMKYAVWTHVGPLDTLHETYHAIYSEWLPKSGLAVAPADQLELYGSKFRFGAPDSEMEIWVPITK